MRNGESLDYYRGFYDALVKTRHLIPAAKRADEQRVKETGAPADPMAYENIVFDMMTLQIGLTMSRMLRRWPKEWQPSIRDGAIGDAAGDAEENDDDGRERD